MDEREKTGWRSSKVDLDAMSDEEVMDLVIAALGRLQPQQLIEVSEAVRTSRLAKEEEVKKALLSEFREKALQLGISFDALLPTQRRTRADAGVPLEPKYRGPNGETWSGRGRVPNWLTSLEAVGHTREEFRIIPES